MGNCDMRDDKSYKAPSSEIGEQEEGDEDASSVVSSEDEQQDPLEMFDDPSPMDDEIDDEDEWLMLSQISP